jgi:hypothetical protein
MASSATPHLTPASLFTKQAESDTLRLRAYNRILSAVHGRIKLVAARPTGEQMCHYDFPEWVPGCPRFEVKDCILFVAAILRQEGFTIIYMSPNRLLISWKDQAMRYFQEESPIRQAIESAGTRGTRPSVSEVPKSAMKGAKKSTAGYQPVSDEMTDRLIGVESKKRAAITFI